MKHELTAKRFQKALSDSGMTQQELANRSGVKKSSISHYMNAAHIPSNINAGKIGEVLNVDPLWLMGLSETMKKNFSPVDGETDGEIIYKISLLTQDNKETLLKIIDAMISQNEKKEMQKNP